MARRKKLPPERFEPFPGFEPKRNVHGDITGAQYYISNHGSVWRVDSSVEFDPVDPTFDIRATPRRSRRRRDGMPGITVNVKIGGGSSARSLPKAVAEVFATVEQPTTCSEYGTWVAVLHPDAPIDPATKLPRCSVIDVYWTPYREQTLWSRGTREPDPELLIPIVKVK